MKRFTKKQIISWAGSVFMIASLVFIGFLLFDQIQSDAFDVSVLTSGGVVAGLLLVAFFEGFGIILAGLNFRALVKNVSGVLVARPLGLLVYTISNVYKYIPGGVMYVVGRNRLALETEDLGHPEVALSTVIEGALVAIAAVLIVLITVFDHALEALREVYLSTFFYVALIAIVVIAGAVVFYFRVKIAEGVRKLSKHMQVLRPLVLLKRFAFAVLMMMVWGGTFLATVVVLGYEVTPGSAITIIGFFLLAWLAGFLTPGAPSGAGVREIIMIALMGEMIGEGTLLMAMIMHRIVAALGDVGVYGVAVLYAHFAGTQSPDTNESKL